VLVSDIVDYNWRVATGDGATWRDAAGNGVAIAISPPTLKLFNGLREYMFANVYTASDAKVDNPKTVFVIHALFEHFCRKPEEMPAEFHDNPRDEPLERRVADYIAGMTDRYAVKTFEQVFVPREWAVFS
jgi:dGTPase